MDFNTPTQTLRTTLSIWYPKVWFMFVKRSAKGVEMICVFISSSCLIKKAVLEPRVSPAFTFTYFCNHCNIRFDPIPYTCQGDMCKSAQGSLCPSPMKIHQSMWIQWLFFQKLEWKRSLNPRWPLTPSLLTSHVWLYPMIIVSKSHENTSKYVGTVTLFSKSLTKGHWPLDDLWPHICWGHMYDSTQGSLCPSPMAIHPYMWIQWSILQNTTYILHTDGTYYVQNEWSHSLFLNIVQARQKQVIAHNSLSVNLRCSALQWWPVLN